MDQDQVQARSARTAGIQIGILLVLLVLIYLPDLGSFVRRALRSPDSAHLLAAPVFIAIMIAFRRAALSAALTRGSVWGLVLLLGSIAVCFGSTWPLNFGYPRYISIVGAVAGAILTVGGWRVLRLSVPMLFVLLLAIPIGQRQYASLILLPERFTIDAVHTTLGLLPGVAVDLVGPDFFFERGAVEGTIALGETRRGGALLITTGLLGAFLTLIRPRPIWQIITMMVLTGPIVLLTNFARLLIYGIVTIYTSASPASAMPRYVSIVGSILLAYGLFAASLGVLGHLVREEPDAAPAGATS